MIIFLPQKGKNNYFLIHDLISYADIMHTQKNVIFSAKKLLNLSSSFQENILCKEENRFLLKERKY